LGKKLIYINITWTYINISFTFQDSSGLTIKIIDSGIKGKGLMAEGRQLRAEGRLVYGYLPPSAFRLPPSALSPQPSASTSPYPIAVNLRNVSQNMD